VAAAARRRRERPTEQPGCRQQVRLLDVHGFRRSFITHCARAGVPKSLCMTMVGHAFQGVHESYERNATGDDLHAMAQRMFDWRRSTLIARVCGKSGPLCVGYGDTQSPEQRCRRYRRRCRSLSLSAPFNFSRFPS